ncbi:outer membrane lipoprotein carrier protein LolA [Oxalobacteraceae bacterium CAVE-383]|nr:outer membrane lipoprotein carrier protein LolA [Oxalobacteraceae bacterium CAVE-383]
MKNDSRKAKNILGALLLAVTCGAGFNAHAAAPVAQIQAVLARPDVMCGRFDQNKQLVGIKKPLASSGRFCVVAGKGVLWRTLQPFPATLRLTRDEIVQMQGDRVAMRLDAKQEPVVKMINSVLFSLLSGDLSQLDQLFEMDGGIQGRQWKVALNARSPALAKAIGKLSLEGSDYVKKVTIDEAGGDHTEILFSDIHSGAQALNAEDGAAFAQ